jgi:low temperature requirement protein LtrA
MRLPSLSVAFLHGYGPQPRPHRADNRDVAHPGAGEHSRVTFFELFFDLVFVFAVTQISHGLAQHLDFEGAALALILLLAMWGLWIYTTWATNWLDPNHLGVRVMLVGVMLAGLIMSAAIPEAFNGGSRGLVFALCLVGANILRTVVLVYATRRDLLLERTFQRITVWFAGSAVSGSRVAWPRATPAWRAGSRPS